MCCAGGVKSAALVVPVLLFFALLWAGAGAHICKVVPICMGPPLVRQVSGVSVGCPGMLQAVPWRCALWLEPVVGT